LQTDLGELKLDFVNDHINYLRPLKKGKSEVFARAIGVNKGLRKILDVTAGLGQDAAVLARLGCEVCALERSDWIFPLLEDAKARAQGRVEWVNNLKFIFADAKNFLSSLSTADRPQVIYMDPMFPEKKKTALPRKEMQIFRSMVGEDADAEELLNLALQKATRRVVVKRPIKASALLEGVSHSFSGSSVRYDMYLTDGE